MLFEEFPAIRLTKGDNEQLKKIMDGCDLKAQLYEAGMENSYRGDVVIRMRSEGKELIIEDINPECYVPTYSEDNVRAEPESQDLLYKMTIKRNNKDVDAWHLEKHFKGSIVHMLFVRDGKDVIDITSELEVYLPGVKDVDTGIDDFLVVHIPNFKTNSEYFGISDYQGIVDILIALDDRMSKSNNILDKHAEPILVAEKGTFFKKDKEGKDVYVKADEAKVVEMDLNKGNPPAYVTWDAKLETTFKYIETLIDIFYMTTGTSPAAFGLDKGGTAESGRALKMKLLRTIANKHTKQIYFDKGIKKLLYTAMKFAKANQLTIKGEAITLEPEVPVIAWTDGIINDDTEVIDNEIKKLDAGVTLKADSIAVIDGISTDEAKKKDEAIKKEKEANMPKFDVVPKVPNQIPPQPPKPPVEPNK
jgi:hypothetical protein